MLVLTQPPEIGEVTFFGFNELDVLGAVRSRQGCSVGNVSCRKIPV